MNTFDLIDIAFTGREQRAQWMNLTDATAFALDRIYNAFDQRDPRRPAATALECNRAEQEGSPPTDDAGTAGVVDSNYDGAPYCSHCGARAAQWCDCGPIASNE